MGKTEFFEIVKGAGIDEGAVDVDEMIFGEDGEVEGAVIKIENDAHLPSQIVQKGCGAGLFYSRVRYRAGTEDGLCWEAEAGYEWNDSMTTYGDEPDCDPSPTFATLQEAAAAAAGYAVAMAEELATEVANMTGGELSNDGKFSPQGWSGFARFELEAA